MLWLLSFDKPFHIATRQALSTAGATRVCAAPARPSCAQLLANRHGYWLRPPAFAGAGFRATWRARASAQIPRPS